MSRLQEKKEARSTSVAFYIFSVVMEKINKETNNETGIKEYNTTIQEKTLKVYSTGNSYSPVQIQHTNA